MKIRTLATAGLIALVAPTTPLFAQEGGLPFEFQNRFRVEFDDNVRQTNDDKDSSLVLIEEINLGKSFTFEQSKLTLSYQPSFRYYEDRDEDDTDFHHMLDATFAHEFSDRLRLSAKEVFRLAEQPELMGNYLGESTIVRENNDYTYNSINVGLDGVVADGTSAGIEYRNTILAYDEDSVSDAYDNTVNTIGLDLTKDIQDNTSVGGELRATSYDYEDDGRDADSFQIGGTARHDFTDVLSGKVRAGFETKDFNDANTDSSEQPYVDGSFQLLPASGSVVNFGASYAMAQAGLPGYANQNRVSVYAGLDQSLAPRVTLSLGGSYALGDYDADEAAAGSDVGDGDETNFILSSKLSYEINDLHAVEANFLHNTLDSDVRGDQEFDQNRFSLGWRLTL